MDIIKQIENEQLRQEKFDFNVGDTVVIGYKIKEGNRERVQAFEGTVIKKQGKGSRATFTVRRVLQGVGVERTFPIHSPRIESLKVIRRGKVRRAKLYYLRDRVGKAAKTKEDIGANLKRDDIVIKEEIPAAPVAEEVKAEEKPVE